MGGVAPGSGAADRSAETGLRRAGAARVRSCGGARLIGVHTLDLEHVGLPGAICSYLILDPEPTLVDPGPPTCLDALRAGLAAHQLSVGDLRHILLTHVHLDHAGASGHLVAENPAIRVHVHEDGAPHMVDPERLVASTRRTFGEAHDRLWGEIRPVPADRISPWRLGSAAAPPFIDVLSTPGHIGHHLSYVETREGTLFAGDALGIILAPGAPAHPPTPPPSVDLVAWPKTLDDISAVGAERAGVTHFGMHSEIADAIQEMRERLVLLEERVTRAMDLGEEVEAQEREAFADEVCAEQSLFRVPDEIQRYFDAFSTRSDWDGVRLYVKRQRRDAQG